MRVVHNTNERTTTSRLEEQQHGVCSSCSSSDLFCFERRKCLCTHSYFFCSESTDTASNLKEEKIAAAKLFFFLIYVAVVA